MKNEVTKINKAFEEAIELLDAEYDTRIETINEEAIEKRAIMERTIADKRCKVSNGDKFAESNIISESKQLLKDVDDWIKIEKSRAKRLLKDGIDTAKKMKAESIKELAIKMKDEHEENMGEALKSIANQIQEWIDENDIHYIAEQGLYCFFNSVIDDWFFVPARLISGKKSYLKEKEIQATFTDMLEAQGRIFNRATHAFKIPPPEHLNLLRMTNWLKPIKGKYNKAFDILIRSLGDNKQENMEHLEHIIWYKYKHPEEFLLPCLVVFGQGGVGKDFFIKNFCQTIFGLNSSSAISVKDLSGFNYDIVGKTIVYINESGQDKADMDILKQVVGSAEINFNKKFGPKGKADNTALYFMGTNDSLSAISLAGDNSDRRWSILKTDRTLNEHINEVYGMGIEYTNPNELDDNPHIKKMLDNLASIIKNPEEASKYLWYLQEKWGDKPRPSRLHGSDYQELIKSQRKTDVMLFEETFLEDDFTFVSLTQLYLTYKQRMLEDSIGNSPGGWSKIRFREVAKKWLKTNAKHIEFKEKVDCVRDGRNTTLSGFKSIYHKGRCVVKTNIQDIIRDTVYPKKDVGKFEFLEDEK